MRPMSILEGASGAAEAYESRLRTRTPSRRRSSALPALAASLGAALGVLFVCATEGAAFAEEPPPSAPEADADEGTGAPEASEPSPAAEPPPEAPAEPPSPPEAPPLAEAPPVEEEAPEPEWDEAGSEAESVEEESGEPAATAIYLSLDGAFSRVDLGALSDDLGLDRTAANGLLYGVSAGVRLKQARLGLRWRVQDTTEFNLWSVGISAGYELPLRPVTPSVSAHVGYVFSRSVEPALVRSAIPAGAVIPPKVEVEALLAGIDLAVTYSPVKFLAVGPFLGADLLVLHRDQARVPRTLFGAAPAEASDRPLYRESGSGLGLGLTAGLRGTFDFGLD